MEGPITYDQLAIFAAFGFTLVGAIVWCATLIANMKSEMHGRINRLREEMNNYKLEVSQKHATIEHLRDMETRVMKPIEALTQEVRSLVHAWRVKEKNGS